MNKTIIGLTGNIATGKSTVMEMLAKRGAFTIDADKLVHRLLARDPVIHSRITQRFSGRVLGAKGAIDRSRLASIVFRNPSALRDLEAIVHPRVGEEVDRLISESEAPFVVVEAIKLLESQLGERCDAIWVTTCSEAKQVERLITDRKMPREKALNRIRSQPPQAEKVARADVVIDTSGSLETTERQVEDAWQNIQPVPDVLDDSFSVRRATPRDVDDLVAFFIQAQSDDLPVDRRRMLASFGDQGYMLAKAGGEIKAVVGWNTEDFIACIRQVIVFPPNPAAGRILLEAVLESATELMCEVVLLFVPPATIEKTIELYRQCGFVEVAVDELAATWRRAARAFMTKGSRVMIHRLREKRLVRPI